MMKYSALLFITISIAFAQTNDELFIEQWGLQNSGQEIPVRDEKLMLTFKKGTAGVDINWVRPETYQDQVKEKAIVAIMDRGIDFEHAEFKDRLWKDPDCTETAVNPCFGHNFFSPSASVMDEDGHGTHIAGIIAARKDGKGVEGVLGDNVLIMPLKVLSSEVQGYYHNKKFMTDYFAEAINFAIEHGASVINMSVGFMNLAVTDNFHRAIKRALKANIPIVAASGNNSKNIPVFPCSSEGVICVGAIDNQNQISEFSNFGNKVDVMAPGEDIISTYPEILDAEIRRLQGYETLRGSSMAAPYVTAIIAAMKSIDPSMTVAEVKARLFSTAKPIPAQEKFSQFGLVDMKAAMAADQTSLVVPQLKSNDRVNVKADGSFEWQLPIERLTGKNDSVFVKILPNEAIQFEPDEFKVETLAAGEVETLTFKGTIDSLTRDNVLTLKFEVNGKEYQSQILAGMQPSELAVTEVSLAQFDPRNFIQSSVGNSARTSLLKYVVGGSSQIKDPEYFYIDRVKSKKGDVHYYHLKVNQAGAVNIQIPVDPTAQVLEVIKDDFNLDGKQDYLVYSFNVVDDKKTFTFDYYNADFTPLFAEQSHWNFYDDQTMLLLNNGLLAFNRRKPEFSWMLYAHPVLGNMRVPVLKLSGSIPDEDNSNDILDYLIPRVDQRWYLLVPDKDQTMKARTLESYQNLSQMRKDLKAKGWQDILFETVLKSSTLNKLRMLVSVGENAQRKYYFVDFTGLNSFSISKVDEYPAGLVLSGNLVFPVMETDGTQKQTTLLDLPDRSKARIAYMKHDGSLTQESVTSANYRDPFFGHIASATMEADPVTFLESRYWIHYYRQGHPPLKIAINRESSFPGVEFSESMEFVETGRDNSKIPGIFVNSTLLYGDQLFVVVPKRDSLIRPIDLSLSVPQNCAYMLPETFMNTSSDYFALNCIEHGKVILKFIPMHN